MRFQSAAGNKHYGQEQRSSISNYEKALISAANSIYQQQRKDGGGGGGGGGGNGASGISGPDTYHKTMPYWKQKRLQMQASRDPNKPIIVRHSSFSDVC